LSDLATYGLYVVLTAAVAAIYFLMPRLERSRPAAGAIFGFCALAGLLVLFAFRGLVESRGAACFYVCTVIALGAGVRVITHTKPIYSAVYFVLLVIAVAGLLVLQSAEFLAAALVIIYAGAILVTYLFVIMLAQQPQTPVYDRSVSEPILALVASFILAGAVASRAVDPINGTVSEAPANTVTSQRAVGQAHSADPTSASLITDANEALSKIHGAFQTVKGNTIDVGGLVMTKYVVALELAGILLLVSMVGAIALSRKKVPIEPYLGARIRLGLRGREAEPF